MAKAQVLDMLKELRYTMFGTKITDIDLEKEEAFYKIVDKYMKDRTNG